MSIIHKIERNLAKNYVNFRGVSLHKKYVIIESDDWGAIRVPDKASYERMLKAGIQVDKDYFDRYDSLESEKDLTELFEVLHSVKDSMGNPAVITPLCILANPDFESIEANGRTQYVFEPVSKTYQRNPWTEHSLNFVNQGISSGVFHPQFHAREHLHAERWLKAVANPTLKEKIAFENHSVIISRMSNDPKRVNLDYFPAYDFDNYSEMEQLKSNMTEGLKMFEDTFGYKSVSFCPPCGVIHDDLFETAAKGGIKGLQAGQHFIPQGKGLPFKQVDHFWGSKTPFGQIYWRRNCTFEPAKNHDYDWVDRCLAEINIAFRWGKPATINSHRVNYIGTLDPRNREDTLRQLKRLLSEIVKRWPDVEFMNSEQLYYTLCGHSQK